MGNNEKIIGIDLGTSNSAACVYMDGKAVMVPSRDAVSLYGKAFPSYVAFTENGNRLVGEPARRQADTNPENTISAIKRKMGTDYKVEILGKEYTPQDISAMILEKIKRDTESFLGEPVSKAVITVPAYFDDNQRTATKDAGEIAGLDVVRLVNEPTAASLAYGIDKKTEEDVTILVFDIGGGTLDVTIMEFGSNVFEVKSTSGDTQLGGVDMDYALSKHLRYEFEKETGIDLYKDEKAKVRLRKGAEKAKIDLSSTIETEVSLPYIALDNGKPLSLKTSVNRSKLESLVKPIIDRCGKTIDQALKDAEMTSDDIDKVILVGGPTRMPSVQDYVEKHIGKPVEWGIDPMECVAQGAAILGSVLNGIDVPNNELGLPTLIDVTPLSLGNVIIGDITSVIIDRNTPIPIKRTKTYTTVEDNQTGVIFEVVQGENKMASNNVHLGEFLLDGIPPARRGIPQIDVTFEIDANGILNASAKERVTGKEQSITITSANKMSREEIESKRKEAEKRREEDERRFKLAQLKNDADYKIYTAKNFIHDYNLNIGDETKSNIENLINKLEIAIAEENSTSIMVQMKNLSDAVADAGSELY